jgi:AcrR family transcriptional regulator
VTPVSQPVNDDVARSARGEQTRALIVETALRLFRERGYEATTMRSIAQEAGVSVGNAYYYFASKEHLVQAYYERMQELHQAAAKDVLARETDFAARLRGVMLVWVGTARPYHAFAGKFFKYAAEPTSPLSPFSRESSSARAASTAIFRAVVDGSDLKMDPQLRADLPDLLWLYHMGVVLFWVHDQSPDAARTLLLIDRTVALIARLVALSRLPVLRSTARQIVALARELGMPSAVA